MLANQEKEDINIARSCIEVTFGYVKLLSQQLLIHCFYHLNQPYIDSLQRIVYTLCKSTYTFSLSREKITLNRLITLNMQLRYVCDPSDRITVLGSKIVERFTLARCKTK